MSAERAIDPPEPDYSDWTAESLGEYVSAALGPHDAEELREALLILCAIVADQEKELWRLRHDG